MHATTAPSNLSDALIRGTRWNRLRNAARRLSRPPGASERHVRTVWLILMQTADGSSPLGVIHTTNWRKADSYYLGAVADSIELLQRHGLGANVWLLPLRTAARGEALRAEIFMLVSRDREEWPVAREYLP